MPKLFLKVDSLIKFIGIMANVANLSDQFSKNIRALQKAVLHWPVFCAKMTLIYFNNYSLKPRSWNLNLILAQLLLRQIIKQYLPLLQKTPHVLATTTTIHLIVNHLLATTTIHLIVNHLLATTTIHLMVNHLLATTTSIHLIVNHLLATTTIHLIVSHLHATPTNHLIVNHLHATPTNHLIVNHLQTTATTTHLIVSHLHATKTMIHLITNHLLITITNHLLTTATRIHLITNHLLITITNHLLTTTTRIHLITNHILITARKIHQIINQSLATAKIICLTRLLHATARQIMVGRSTNNCHQLITNQLKTGHLHATATETTFRGITNYILHN